MRKCPRCKTRMSSGLRWSRSKKRLRIFHKCKNCCIWGYPEDFK